MSRWRRFLCNVLDWHSPDDTRPSFDSVSFGSNCRHCRRRILMDSNGDWFSVGA